MGCRATGNKRWLPVRRDDKLTTSVCRLSGNLGTSTSWNTQWPSRPVMGLLYLYLYLYVNYIMYQVYGDDTTMYDSW